MKKNAFTLVELLAVIVILGILVTIITPKLMNLLDDKQNVLYDNTIEEIKNIAKLYAADNADIYNIISSDGYIYVSIDTLCEEKYIKCPINNPKDNSNIKGAIKITYKNETFNYEYVEDAPEKFETDSWPTIIAAVQSGEYPYKVGDTKKVDLGTTLGTHTLRIANTKRCSEKFPNGIEGKSETACGFVLEFADIITEYNMNPSGTYKETQYDSGWNKDGFPASSMYSYLNVVEGKEGSGTIYNALPEELRKAIIDTKVISSHGNKDTDNFTTEGVKLYLLSPEEVWSEWSDTFDSAKGTSGQLDYYSNLGVSTYNFLGESKKLNGDVYWWWLRSADSIDDRYFYVVYGGGWARGSAYGSGGVSPAFRIAS